MAYSRRIRAPKYKRGTPVRDRVDPQLQERGYNTSTLRLTRLGRGGGTYEIVINDRIIGEYDALHDKLHLCSNPEE